MNDVPELVRELEIGHGLADRRTGREPVVDRVPELISSATRPTSSAIVIQ